MKGTKNMVHRNFTKSGIGSPVVPSEPKKTNQSARDDHDALQGTSLNTHDQQDHDRVGIILQGQCLAPVDVAKETVNSTGDSGRERLKRHRTEVAGRVWIPEIWGQEELLKDWIDCSAFDAPLVPGGIISARAALVEEGRRANSSGEDDIDE
ncbi:hypothetical protein HHK36_011389 [Tetracentron sinense]|uniref:Protein BIC1 n=1 Tax=Tetracentron sinense TaxID=13715 RepID=A0A834ZB23_TETSI|nr:hypothetical protein HHK36_011389 [Tetracentron sinense]